MTYPIVASAVDLGPARGPRLGICWHMAEGGGTVGYLSRPNPNGVSVHFVVELSGRIVQMLALDHMHSSIRTSDLRATDDPDGLYGATAAHEVLGPWATTMATLGPNHATIGVEVEGFAAGGPNDAQRAACAALWADLEARYPGIRSLGHRDFADYKPCPGTRFPWAAVGGHGQEDPMGLHVTIPAEPATGSLAIPAGTDAIRVADATHYRVPTSVRRAAYAAALTGPNSGPGWLVDLGGDELHFIRAATGLTFTPAASDCAAAIAADRARARIVYGG